MVVNIKKGQIADYSNKTHSRPYEANVSCPPVESGIMRKDDSAKRGVLVNDERQSNTNYTSNFWIFSMRNNKPETNDHQEKFITVGIQKKSPHDQTHSEAKLPAELVVLGGLRKETPKGSLPLCPLCEGLQPSDQISEYPPEPPKIIQHPIQEASLPNEFGKGADRLRQFNQPKKFVVESRVDLLRWQPGIRPVNITTSGSRRARFAEASGVNQKQKSSVQSSKKTNIQKICDYCTKIMNYVIGKKKCSV